jgi:hypothetical protein
LLVIEDIRPERRMHLFTFAGISIQATRYAWLAFPDWIALGLLIAIAQGRGNFASGFFTTGLLYGVSLCLSNVIHSLGHIVGKQDSPGGDTEVKNRSPLFFSDASLGQSHNACGNRSREHGSAVIEEGTFPWHRSPP